MRQPPTSKRLRQAGSIHIAMPGTVEIWLPSPGRKSKYGVHIAVVVVLARTTARVELCTAGGLCRRGCE